MRYRTEERIKHDELQRLQKLYPLFEVSITDPNKWSEFGGYQFRTGRGTQFGCRKDKLGRIANDAERRLDKDHAELVIAKFLMDMYSDLYISTHIDRNGVIVSAWVNRPRDNQADDAESIGSLPLYSANLHYTLHTWNVQARLAKQEGWFFCTGHRKAEKQLDGWFFHFAGQYCKEYGDGHPDKRAEAARETYN